jgi:hypothetical protein
MALGNTPRRETSIALEASKSYSLGMLFKGVNGEPLDLTNAIVRLAMAESSRQGSMELLTKTAVDVGSAQGLVQFQFQADELALDPGSYPFDVTLIPESGFSTPILKGFIEIGANADSNSANVFTHSASRSDITAILEKGDLVEIQFEQVDGLYTLAEQMILDFKLSLAQELGNVDTAVRRAEEAAQRSEMYAAELREWMVSVGFPFWQGTQAQFDNIPNPDPNVLYLILDEQAFV